MKRDGCRDERTGFEKLLVGIVNEFPFQMPFPSCLKFGSYEKEISVFSVGQILFSVFSTSWSFVQEGILVEKILNKFNLFQMSFSSHWIRITRKRNFSFLVEWIFFLFRHCQIEFLHETFTRKWDVSKFFFLNILSKF